MCFWKWGFCEEFSNWGVLGINFKSIFKNFNSKIQDFDAKIVSSEFKTNKKCQIYGLADHGVKRTILKVIKKRDLGINGLFMLCLKNVSVD